MVDSKILKSRFGVNVIACNLSPEEKYLLSEKNTLNESAKVKIKHLNESVFDSTEELLAFVSNNLDTDVDLCNDSSPDNINNMFKAFNDYSLVNPHFDPERIETWCDGVENALHDCGSILDVNNAEMTEIPLNEDGSLNVPDSVLKDNIYKDLDDNSILLLYGMLTGNFNTGYVSDMRNTIYNDIQRNKEKSPVGRVVLHSLKESKAMTFGSLVESYKVGICKMAQKNKTVLFEEDGFLKAISKMGNNKYSVITLNESAPDNDTLTEDDKALIMVVGTIREYKEFADNSPEITPQFYVEVVFDSYHESSSTRAKRLYEKLRTQYPSIADKILSDYGDDFLNNRW